MIAWGSLVSNPPEKIEFQRYKEIKSQLRNYAFLIFLKFQCIIPTYIKKMRCHGNAYYRKGHVFKAMLLICFLKLPLPMTLTSIGTKSTSYKRNPPTSPVDFLLSLLSWCKSKAYRFIERNLIHNLFRPLLSKS